MGLEEFYCYKNQIISDLLTNKSIVGLINETIEEKDVRSLVRTQVFPCKWIPETIEEGNTFVCCEVEIQKVSSRTFLDPVIYIWIFTHKSKAFLPSGGLRIDELSSKIDEILNGSREYGLGELELVSVNMFTPFPDFQGRIMTFRTKDFNRTHDRSKVPPEKRKVHI